MKVCAQPGCHVLHPSGRCPEHTMRRVDPATRTRNSRRWKNTSTRILTDWRMAHGDWCPGDTHHPPHPSLDLTVNHLDELQATNGHDTGRYTVLCRSANSARRDR